jgi:hypothetical protein
MTLAKRREPVPRSEDISPTTVYSAQALAHKLRVTVEAVGSFVKGGLLKFVPGAEGSQQFLGKHVLEFLDGYAQTVLRPARPTHATARGRKLTTETQRAQRQEGEKGKRRKAKGNKEVSADDDSA